MGWHLEGGGNTVLGEGGGHIYIIIILIARLFWNQNGVGMVVTSPSFWGGHHGHPLGPPQLGVCLKVYFERNKCNTRFYSGHQLSLRIFSLRISRSVISRIFLIGGIDKCLEGV